MQPVDKKHKSDYCPGFCTRRVAMVGVANDPTRCRPSIRVLYFVLLYFCISAFYKCEYLFNGIFFMAVGPRGGN